MAACRETQHVYACAYIVRVLSGRMRHPGVRYKEEAKFERRRPTMGEHKEGCSENANSDMQMGRSKMSARLAPCGSHSHHHCSKFRLLAYYACSKGPFKRSCLFLTHVFEKKGGKASFTGTKEWFGSMQWRGRRASCFLAETEKLESLAYMFRNSVFYLCKLNQESRT